MRSVVLAVCCGCASLSSTGVTADQEAVLVADRRFDQETAERGVDGWVSWFAANGVQVAGDQLPIIGRDAIRAAMAPALAGADLRWAPDRAEVLVPGALVVTSGTYVSTRKSPPGAETQRATGRYVSLWRKQEDGSWKVLFDTGVPDVAESEALVE